MSSRWVIYSGSEQFGPWNASRIRDELRAGRVDPFDMVCLEGSQIKKPLIEVDEIFESSAIQAAAIIPNETLPLKASSSDVSIDNGPSMRPKLKVVGDSPDAEKQTSKPLPDSNLQRNIDQQFAADLQSQESPDLYPQRPRAFEALAAKDALIAPRKVGSLPASARQQTPGVDTKRYIIWRTGRTSDGPYSSREILASWYKKQISSDCSVQRLGHAKRIGIIQFVRFYEKNSPSRSAVLRQALLVMKAKTAASWWLTIAIVMAMLIILSAFFFRASLTLTGPVLESIPADELSQTQPGDVTSSMSTDKFDRFLPPENAQETAQEGPSKGNAMTSPPAKKPVDRKPEVSRRKARAPQNSVPRYQSKYKPPPRAVTISPPPRSQSSVSTGMQTSPRPAGVPTSVRPVTTRPNSTGFVDGATVTIVNYRFNAAQLDACEMKCKILMNGPQGPVTAVFFKEAFGAAFLGKSNGVTLSGTVRKDPGSGGIQILVQSVK